MNLYFNTDTRRFQVSAGDSREVNALTFKRGDTTALAVRFVSAGAVVELGAGAAGKFGLKESGDYSGDYIASDTAWTKTGTGTSTVYTFNLNLATSEINALLANDADSVNVIAEMEYDASGVIVSSNTLTITIQNDVIKGDESGPTEISGGTPVNESVTISGTITPNATGDLLRAEPTIDFDYQWTTDGASTPPGSGTWDRLGYDSGQYVLVRYVDGVQSAAWSANSTVNLDPTSQTLFASTGAATGTATVSWKGNGTEGYLGSMKVNASYLYVVAEVDTTKPYWKKIALTAL